MVIRMCGHHIEQSKDQLGKVADPTDGQLNRENEHFPVPVRARDLARRVCRTVPRKPGHSPYPK